MKKTRLIMYVLCLFALTACNGPEPKTLHDFYTEEGLVTIREIIITDGSTGYEKTVSDPRSITEFLELTDRVLFTPQENQQERDGFLYSITLSDGRKKFLFNLNKIHEVYYDTKPDLYPIIDRYSTEINSR